jgi:uncharacterized protein (TIGR03435 family)
MWMNRCFSALFVIAIVAGAQTASTRFEAASIRPSKPDATMKDMRLSFQNDRFEAINITLKEILSAMSGFSMSVRVEGGASWTETARYDIVAKAERTVPVNDRNRAVMSVLEARFKLITHRETKEDSGLALTVGKKELPIQRSQGRPTDQISGGRQHLVFQGVTMFRLANYLSQIWRTTVEDHTSMPGAFDFSVDPDRFSSTPSDPFSDLLRSAMEDLGFVLQSRRVTVEITVIDHAERPTEN